MVHPLYWVSDLVYAFVLAVMLLQERRIKTELNKEEKAFRLLLGWVIFFCLQDTFWGIAGGSFITDDRVFFVASMIFHLSTVTTTFFWLYYILTYLGDRVKHPKLLLYLDGLVMAFQAVLVIWNCFQPVIFRIENGSYITEFLRPLAFFNQYVVYLLISIMTAFYTFALRKENDKVFTVFLFSLAPVVSGAFQLQYPDGPFYSMGYFLGCFIIHIFVVTKDRDELKELHAASELSRQKELANRDRLTGLLNRRAYEEDTKNCQTNVTSEDLVYLTVDINGLKSVNDTYGHAAGDELIQAAADCLSRILTAYGKVYRIGGDEFAALLRAPEGESRRFKEDIIIAAAEWHGKLAPELSFSVGVARGTESPDGTFAAMAKIADERMYRHKAEYYSRRGVDRRGRNQAFNSLCASYTKILRINVSTDCYAIISMDTAEQVEAMGFGPKISAWLHDFGASGWVYPDDLEEYLEKTDLKYISRFFLEQHKSLNLFYRRKTGENFRMNKMEMIPTENYADDNQELYLFVKDIDR